MRCFSALNSSPCTPQKVGGMLTATRYQRRKYFRLRSSIVDAIQIRGPNDFNHFRNFRIGLWLAPHPAMSDFPLRIADPFEKFRCNILGYAAQKAALRVHIPVAFRRCQFGSGHRTGYHANRRSGQRMGGNHVAA